MRYTGVSPIAYLNDYRLAKAAALTLETQWNAAKV